MPEGADCIRLFEIQNSVSFGSVAYQAIRISSFQRMDVATACRQKVWDRSSRWIGRRCIVCAIVDVACGRQPAELATQLLEQIVDFFLSVNRKLDAVAFVYVQFDRAIFRPLSISDTSVVLKVQMAFPKWTRDHSIASGAWRSLCSSAMNSVAELDPGGSMVARLVPPANVPIDVSGKESITQCRR
jgi:hypothetical protein